MINNRTYGIDLDVLAYNARIVAGGNQGLGPVGMRQVNQFVIGLKKMQLWDLAANIFLLSSNQNAGAGTTVYGLKPNNDGTFLFDNSNRIEWSTNGMIFYAPPSTDGIGINGSCYVECPPLQVYRGNVTFFAIGKGNTENNLSRAVYFVNQGSLSDGDRIIRIWANDAFNNSVEIGYGNLYDQSTNARVLAGTGFNSVSYTAYYDSSTTNGFLKVYKNGILVTTTATAAMTIPAYDSSLIYPGPIKLKLGGYVYKNDTKLHFFGAFYKTLSDQEHKDVNNLIKRTVGEGLALP
jgi:hypothetical protein